MPCNVIILYKRIYLFIGESAGAWTWVRDRETEVVSAEETTLHPSRRDRGRSGLYMNIYELHQAFGSFVWNLWTV
jgi:hypothetical protein